MYGLKALGCSINDAEVNEMIFRNSWEIQRRIQNTVKYLRWSVLGKSLTVFWQGFEYASGVGS